MAEERKIWFIINPIAGNTGKERIVKAIEQYHYDEHHHIAVFKTKYPGHAREIALKAVESNIDTIVAVGGDGTVNETAGAIIHTGVNLGIIPSGSGNGLARHLHIPRDVPKALKVILQNKLQCIDTGLINGKPFISVTGIGFDAFIADLFSQGKGRGFLNYLIKTVSHFKGYQPNSYKVKINGAEIERKALLISFANSCQFGYNAVLSPSASLTDGKLDVCILRKPGLIKTLFLIPKLFNGTLHKTKYLEVMSSSEAQILCERPEKSHIDGEPSDSSVSYKVIISPGSLKLIVP